MLWGGWWRLGRRGRSESGWMEGVWLGAGLGFFFFRGVLVVAGGHSLCYDDGFGTDRYGVVSLDFGTSKTWKSRYFAFPPTAALPNTPVFVRLLDLHVCQLLGNLTRSVDLDLFIMRAHSNSSTSSLGSPLSENDAPQRQRACWET